VTIESNVDLDNIRVILALDCGSTTSKARLFKKIAGEYRFLAKGEAPTTVEEPHNDVMVGVRNSISELEELSGYKILSRGELITPNLEEVGVDLLVTTSSAGGGLIMLVVGLMRFLTAESAERTALGAGAMVMDVMAKDDGRPFYEKIDVIRRLKPDMILLVGGFDDGNIDDVLTNAEIIASASPKPRLGSNFKLPVIYAGNVRLRDHIKKILEPNFVLKMTENVRTNYEEENPWPARKMIEEVFVEHVMAHAPGYDKLMKWTSAIIPTPEGEGRIFRAIAAEYETNLIGVGLGGATINVYSVYDGRYVRTVNANLGMSYSICNILRMSGYEKISRWLPFDIKEFELRNRISNKMIRPTILPQTLRDLLIEHAIAREAIRLAIHSHRSLPPGKPLTRPLPVQSKPGEGKGRKRISNTIVDISKIGWLIGTGGLLSHAPRRIQSALILIDGIEPQSETNLAQDNIFMMPHLGVLSKIYPKAAMEILKKDCLIRLGTSISLAGQLRQRDKGRIKAAEIHITYSNEEVKETLWYGSIKRFRLDDGETASVRIKPHWKLNPGAGTGRTLKTNVEGGAVGLIIDCRGRPVQFHKDRQNQKRELVDWFKALNVYPKKILEKWEI
jgi:uncharacterized protein (TIGR01319 family)